MFAEKFLVDDLGYHMTLIDTVSDDLIPDTDERSKFETTFDFYLLQK
jgi:hypothetical protein